MSDKTDFIRLFLISMFTRITPRELEGIFHNNSIDGRWKMDKRMSSFAQLVSKRILNFAPFINNDKIAQMSSIFMDEWGKSIDYKDSAINPFYVLLHFSNECMTLKDGIPVAKFSSLLRLRELSELIGEDIISCSLIAYKNRLEDTSSFVPKLCSPSCGDDVDLNHFLSRGLAELHQHLYASSDTFTLTWICLMNHITKRTKTFKALSPVRVLNSKEMSSDDLYDLVSEAALLRLNLFRRILNLKEYEIKEVGAKIYYGKKALLQEYINIQCIESSKFFTSDYSCLDYAFRRTTLVGQENPLNGEIFILYQTLKKIYAEPHNLELTIDFYKYILIKNILRENLVQNNSRTGFGNFAVFEGRKDIFIDEYKKYDDLKIKMPLVDAFTNHHVTYIETRIAPKVDFNKLNTQFNRIYGISSKTGTDVKFIYHFIKAADNHFKPFCPRHDALRQNVKHQAINIVNLRNNRYQARQNIIGIDAANSEIKARPEVFAQAYRYLRYHAYDKIHSINSAQKSEYLHFTFHAGEDFYDIADGLRAIDEAISLLHMTDGDRLGHCIALGIDAKKYYQSQSNTIIIPKQWLIDNCAWIIKKSRELNIVIKPKLYEDLVNLFNELSLEIYKGLINPFDYIQSMSLRGDNPKTYPITEKQLGHVLIGNWQSFDLDNSRDTKISRTNDKARKLYYRYHYEQRVREAGEKVQTFKISDLYIDLITELQEAMMKELEDKGLVIEACPTSNFKIGTPDRFDEQPILRFFPLERSKNSHNIRVTINTDDLGIFPTALDHEYAILAVAALKAKDKSSNFKYTRQQVLDWLEVIRENGFKYKFSNTNG